MNKIELALLPDTGLDGLIRATFFFSGAFSFDIKHLLSINNFNDITYCSGTHSGEFGFYVRCSITTWNSIIILNRDYEIFSQKHDNDLIGQMQVYYPTRTDCSVKIMPDYKHVRPIFSSSELDLRYPYRLKDFTDCVWVEEVTKAVFLDRIKKFKKFEIDSVSKTKIKYYFTATETEVSTIK